MPAMVPFILPFGTLVGAVWTQSRHRRRAQSDQLTGPVYGGLPVLLPAAGSAAVDWAASTGLTVMMVRLFMGAKAAQQWGEGQTDDAWSADSDAWYQANTGQMSALHARGLKIDPDCAWILSPQTQFMRFAQLVEKAASRQSEGLAQRMRPDIDQAFGQATERFGTEIARNPLVGQGLGDSGQATLVDPCDQALDLPHHLWADTVAGKK